MGPTVTVGLATTQPCGPYKVSGIALFRGQRAPL